MRAFGQGMVRAEVPSAAAWWAGGLARAVSSRLTGPPVRRVNLDDEADEEAGTTVPTPDGSSTELSARDSLCSSPLGRLSRVTQSHEGHIAPEFTGLHAKGLPMLVAGDGA